MITINSGFIGNYKLGDNIAFNLKTLNLFYQYYSTENDENKKLLIKPMIVLIGSCTEAILHDLYRRIRGHTTEGVSALTDKAIEAIQGLKKIDKFDLYITHAEKHDFFEASHTDMYFALRELRKLRNRVHIQNEKNYFEPDDAIAFNNEQLEMSEKTLEAVMKTMQKKFLRSKTYNHVEDFILPWSEHWTDGSF